MRRGTKPAACTVLAAAFSLTFLTGCVNEETPLAYTNELLGYTFEIPESWQGKYLLEESGKETTVYALYGDADTPENEQEKGVLFTISAEPGELIYEFEDISAANGRIIGYGNGYTYYAVWPGDVQWFTEEQSAQYRKMEQEARNLLDTIRIGDAAPPPAEADGYRTVGTGYFTAEIPAQWELRQGETPYAWKIEDEAGETAGEIKMVSYSPGDESILGFGEGVASLIDGKQAWTAVLCNDEAFRAMQVIVYGADMEETGSLIAASLSMRGGMSNSIDAQSASNVYIARGAHTITGIPVEIAGDGSARYMVVALVQGYGTDGLPVRTGEQRTYPCYGVRIIPGEPERTFTVLDSYRFAEALEQGEYQDMAFTFTIHDDEIKVMAGL